MPKLAVGGQDFAVLRVSGRIHGENVHTLREVIDQFRMDLYYRLNVFPIGLPPLRRRMEDIPALIAHLVDKYARRMSKQISKIANDALDTLMGYAWPGNIRELQNFIERAVILTNSDVLQLPPLRSCIPESGEAGDLSGRKSGITY
jgi:transcriptional regulator with PAS, ATPase and Fis domain